METLCRIGSLGLMGLFLAACMPAAHAQDDDDFDRGSLGLLKVTGPDGRSFLQDLRQEFSGVFVVLHYEDSHHANRIVA